MLFCFGLALVFFMFVFAFCTGHRCDLPGDTITSYLVLLPTTYSAIRRTPADTSQHPALLQLRAHQGKGACEPLFSTCHRCLNVQRVKTPAQKHAPAFHADADVSARPPRANVRAVLSTHTPLHIHSGINPCTIGRLRPRCHICRFTERGQGNTENTASADCEHRILCPSSLNSAAQPSSQALTAIR